MKARAAKADLVARRPIRKPSLPPPQPVDRSGYDTYHNHPVAVAAAARAHTEVMAAIDDLRASAPTAPEFNAWDDASGKRVFSAVRGPLLGILAHLERSSAALVGV